MRYNLKNGQDAPSQRPSMANDRLRKALIDRDRFLARHPHLLVYQAEIDGILDKSGGHQGRLAVLGTLMQSKLLELQKEFYKLTCELKIIS